MPEPKSPRKAPLFKQPPSFGELVLAVQRLEERLAALEPKPKPAPAPKPGDAK